MSKDSLQKDFVLLIPSSKNLPNITKLKFYKQKDYTITVKQINENTLIGVQRYKSGACYKGYFNLNLDKDGFGLFQKGKSFCYGIFNEGKLNGLGVERFEDGSIYEGEFENGKKNGIGKYLMKNGKQYIGYWTNNSFDGLGEYHFTKEKYFIGNFSKNKMNGFGFYIYPTMKYFSNYQNDIKHGISICYDILSEKISIVIYENGIKNGPYKEISNKGEDKVMMLINGIEQKVNCSMLGRLMDSFTTEDNAIDYWFSLSYQELISIFSDVSNN